MIRYYKLFDLLNAHVLRRMNNKRTLPINADGKGAPVRPDQPVINHNSSPGSSRPCAQRWRRSCWPGHAAARCGG